MTAVSHSLLSLFSIYINAGFFGTNQYRSSIKLPPARPELACFKISFSLPHWCGYHVDDYGILHRRSEPIAGSAGIISRGTPRFLEARGGRIPAIRCRQVPAATHRDLCAPGERTAAGVQHPAHRSAVPRAAAGREGAVGHQGGGGPRHAVAAGAGAVGERHRGDRRRGRPGDQAQGRGGPAAARRGGGGCARRGRVPHPAAHDQGVRRQKGGGGPQGRHARGHRPQEPAARRRTRRAREAGAARAP